MLSTDRKMIHYLTTMIVVLKMSIKISITKTTDFMNLKMNKILMITILFCSIVIITLFLFCFLTFEHNKVFKG